MTILRRFFIKAIKFNNYALFIGSITLIVISSFAMVRLEPETFPSLFDSFWWVMTTVTTVGYGDFYPVTYWGRIYAIFLYIIGIGLIGIVIGKLVDSFGVLRRRKEEGLVKIKEKGHIVIIGWSQKANLAIQEILSSEAKMEVVIVDVLPKAPLNLENVHYVKGDATNEEVLKRANLMEARSVLIFADDTIQEAALTDGKTLMIVTTIERLAPHIHSTVEIKDEKHIQNFRHVKVDEFVLTHETISRLAVRSAFSQGISSIYRQLMSRQQGDNLYEIKKKEHWRSYRDAFNELLQEGATLIADRDRLNINRYLDESIPIDARLYIICDYPTFQSINKG